MLGLLRTSLRSPSTKSYYHRWPGSLASNFINGEKDEDDDELHCQISKKRPFSSRAVSPELRTRIRELRESDEKPTIAEAKEMTLATSDMSTSTIITLSGMGHRGALKEMVIRDIMTADEVSHDKASEIFDEIDSAFMSYTARITIPYMLGIATALSAGIVSAPIVFNLELAEWFNERYVTMDVPEPEDLETGLEVGIWTWNWMEPPLGQISFFLLCLQFSKRVQARQLEFKSYTERVKEWRGRKVAQQFPDYSEMAIVKYSEASPLLFTQRSRQIRGI